MLIEVHVIQNHAPSNLNRDDSGSPKSSMFGGYRRARISSQCLKRCYRTSKTFRDEVDGLGMHTCAMPGEVIRRVLRDGTELTDDEEKRLKATLVSVIKRGESGGGGSSDTDEAKETEAAEIEKVKVQKEPKTAQSVFWRECELNALAGSIKAWASGNRRQSFDPGPALKSVGLNWNGIPVDMALFGRMVTSDLMHNVEASSQFAHAISTHEFVREFDFWTRVDDRRDRRLDWYRDAYGSERIPEGTDGMGDAEFTSACYYSYFNVDFSALVDNLTGKALKRDLDDSEDRKQAERKACNAVVGLVKAAIFERPTGKFNSMCTPSLPALVLVEVRDSHVPVSYADAFAKPVDPKSEETQSDTGQVQRVSLPEESARRLIKEANRITTTFCRKASKRLLFTGGRELGECLEDLGTAPVFAVSNTEELAKELRAALGFAQEREGA